MLLQVGLTKKIQIPEREGITKSVMENFLKIIWGHYQEQNTNKLDNLNEREKF